MKLNKAKRAKVEKAIDKMLGKQRYIMFRCENCNMVGYALSRTLCPTCGNPIVTLKEGYNEYPR